eukprot:Gregarina_sp_Poly_1__6221@NODE_329_length_9477_cov_82_111477_g279_i0_p2_GENE_NODE_329_length_9477_cov_82_111477_g279_i0NODE_329_length_9477_cov_82_111477_g279_i0_p2_ORF_typecomplete_len542_score81_27Peptidase_M16/PF00675_20/3_6e32Peptidase_M16_C/PF05193_21/1_7e10Peptidase_M16_C/PF05193_21/2_1e03M16C_assoc/PF08367_11/0_13_NODE_329_length_9477_cov_82_111477_g279_i019773602
MLTRFGQHNYKFPLLPSCFKRPQWRTVIASSPRQLSECQARWLPRTKFSTKSLAKHGDVNVDWKVPETTFLDTTVKTLKNGATIVVSKLGSSPNTATVGVWLKIGSGAETPDNNGVVHFLEHMTFKGTRRKSKAELERYIEQRGAHMNAYTTKEYVAYISNCLSQTAVEMLKLILEVLTESELSPPYVEEEKAVILRELEEVELIGEEALFDRIHCQVFPDHALGRTILGSPSHIQNMTKQRLQKFVQQNYTPQNMILIAAGDVNIEEIENLASQLKQRKCSTPALPDPNIKFVPGSRCFIESSTDPVLEGPVLYVAQTVPTVAWNDSKCMTLTLARSMLSHAIDDNAHTERALQGSRAKVPTSLASPTNLNTPIFFDAYYRHIGIAGWYLLHSTKDIGLENQSYPTQTPKKLAEIKANILQVLDRAHHSTRRQIEQKVKDWTAADLLEAKHGLLSIYDQTCDTSSAICEEQTRQIMTKGRLMIGSEIESQVMRVTLEEVKQLAKETFTPFLTKYAMTGFLRIPTQNRPALVGKQELDTTA